MTGGFNGLMLPTDLRGFNAGKPVVAKLLTFMAAALFRLDAILELAAKRDLFNVNPLAAFDDERNDDVLPTVRFATLFTTRFTDANFEMTAGRPILDADEFEREVAADSPLTATGSFRARFPDGTVGVTTRAANERKKSSIFLGIGIAFDLIHHLLYWLLHSLDRHSVWMVAY